MILIHILTSFHSELNIQSRKNVFSALYEYYTNIWYIIILKIFIKEISKKLLTFIYFYAIIFE